MQKNKISNNFKKDIMRKKMIKVAFVAAIALVGGINVFNAQKSEMLSDITLANAEALAEGEVIVGMPCMVVPNNYCLYIGQTPDQDFELPGAFHN